MIAGLLLAGCVEEAGFDSPKHDISVTFSAEYPSGDQSSTKIAIDAADRTKLVWNGDENATMIFGREGKNNSTNPSVGSVAEGEFSGKISIPTGFTLADIKGVIMPAENEGNFRGSNGGTAIKRLRMYVKNEQRCSKVGTFDLRYCPFFAPISATQMENKGNDTYEIQTLKLKSAADLIRFNIYGKHPSQKDSEILKSIRIDASDRISGTAEWEISETRTSLNSNGDAWSSVILEDNVTIADKGKENGIKLYMSVVLGGKRTINKITITTDKAIYTKTISKTLAQKNINDFNIYPVNISLASGFTREAITVYPEDKAGWKTGIPEEHGFDSKKLETITDYVSQTDLTCMMIIAGGEQIYSYGDQEFISYLASCRKSILSMMYGKYVENGTIDLNLTVGQMITDYGMKEDVGGLLDSEKEATINDLITARSGIYHEASNAGDATDKPQRGTYKHGEYYLYNNWDFNFAGAVFERLVRGSYSGKEIYSILQEDIAEPIGMADYSLSKQKYGGTWKVSSSGVEPPSYYPAYHFYLSTRDMARIGYLMLRKGKWKGVQVISEEWIKKTTTPVSTFKEVNPDGSGYYSYGYMWWIFDYNYYKSHPTLEGAYTASGSGGQFICVIPKLDMVVAWKTSTANNKSTSSSQLRSVLSKIAAAYTGTL